jgi:phospholipid/cholesterol/gamma-HCH transport system substrate-binding protein
VRTVVVISAIAVTVAVVAGVAAMSAPDYQVSVMLPSATNVVPGGTVEIKGFSAGKVSDIEPVGGQAKVTMELDSPYAPLHDGAVATVRWNSLVGERHLTITDGPASNITVPSGGMLKGNMPQPMELDQVLAALDPPTRQRLTGLINNLQQTLNGHEQDLNSTVQTAGPALQALGQVLQGLGTDGPAISALVTQVEHMVSTLSNRDGQVRDIVDQLSALSGNVVQQRQALGQVLQRLPGTLHTATTTLGDVPGVVDKTVPLLDDLKPATDQLPAVAGNLKPVLQDLRPLVAQLRPTLASAQTLLQYTPGLLDEAHAVVPGATSLVNGLLPAIDFLRPYTPELVGFLTNWSSAMSNYGGDGHYARVLAEVGLSSVNINPGITPVGFGTKTQPAPGELVNQPWTDATGGGVK